MLAAFPLLLLLAQTPEVSPLKPIQVDKVASHRLGKIRRCYAKEHDQTPRLFGVIAVGMAVSPDGTVTDRWIALSTMSSPKLESCVLAAFDGLQFPAPGPPGAEVRYGMLFTAKDTPPDPAKVQEEAWRAAVAGRSQ